MTKEMFEGINKSFYKQRVRLMTLPTGTDGCRKFVDFEADPKEKVAILLEETDNCPISNRASYAYESNVSMIFIKHTSDNLDELSFTEEIIRGISLPLLYV